MFDEMDKLRELLHLHEGLRLQAYLCTAGKLTVGYGHNCEAVPVPGVTKVGDAITQKQAEDIFADDMGKCISGVQRALPWVLDLTSPRQAVLYDMAFNMGLGGIKSGLLSFRNTLDFIKRGQYGDAARNMLLSKWAEQVKSRAKRLAKQMETGEWQV